MIAQWVKDSLCNTKAKYRNPSILITWLSSLLYSLSVTHRAPLMVGRPTSGHSHQNVRILRKGGAVLEPGPQVTRRAIDIIYFSILLQQLKTRKLREFMHLAPGLSVSLCSIVIIQDSMRPAVSTSYAVTRSGNRHHYTEEEGRKLGLGGGS